MTDRRDPLDVPAGRRTTGDIDILVIEAELVAEGKDVENPAIPADTDVAREAAERIVERGMEPQWGEVDER